jgi:hypothetical protein
LGQAQLVIKKGERYDCFSTSNCIFNRPWDDHYGENLYKTYFTKASRSREVMMDALKDWEKEKQNLFSYIDRGDRSQVSIFISHFKLLEYLILKIYYIFILPVQYHL